MINDIFKKPIAKIDFTVEDLNSPEQKELYLHWLRIKGNNQMPSKASFDPIALPKVLPFISMEDVELDPVRFRVRLTGSKTASLLNSTGQYLDEIPGTEDVTKMLKQMVVSKKPYFYTSNITWDERRYKTYSSIVLPFSEDGENVTLCMACHYDISFTKLSM